jgi:hypothetical protein
MYLVNVVVPAYVDNKDKRRTACKYQEQWYLSGLKRADYVFQIARRTFSSSDCHSTKTRSVCSYSYYTPTTGLKVRNLQYCHRLTRLALSFSFDGGCFVSGLIFPRDMFRSNQKQTCLSQHP